jgi:hypothetical protein
MDPAARSTRLAFAEDRSQYSIVPSAPRRTDARGRIRPKAMVRRTMIAGAAGPLALTGQVLGIVTFAALLICPE